MTDLELFEAWIANDRRAADELFERHFSRIDRFFRNKVVEGSDDLVQKTFMACVENHKRFRGDSSFRTYLFGIAHNVLHGHYRSRKRESERLEFTEISAQDLAPGPSTMIRERREHQLLLESLRQIPLDYQVVLELYYWEELSGSAIAKIIELRENTVRSRIREGKRLLKKKMKALARNPEELRSTLEDLEHWVRSIHAGGEPADEDERQDEHETSD
ncbi:RNA polymerase sigma factor [Enhygromyxa salina]|nr:RNA polymerase sigma factor [Enhygromyxa salina]